MSDLVGNPEDRFSRVEADSCKQLPKYGCLQANAKEDANVIY